MTMRKIDIQAQDLRARIDELHNQKVFLHANLDELDKLQKKLRNGDTSVIARVNELFDLIDEKRKWIKRNTPIIRKQMAS